MADPPWGVNGDPHCSRSYRNNELKLMFEVRKSATRIFKRVSCLSALLIEITLIEKVILSIDIYINFRVSNLERFDAHG